MAEASPLADTSTLPTVMAATHARRAAHTTAPAATEAASAGRTRPSASVIQMRASVRRVPSQNSTEAGRTASAAGSFGAQSHPGTSTSTFTGSLVSARPPASSMSSELPYPGSQASTDHRMGTRSATLMR